METLLHKDKLQEVNPYLFQKIQNRILQKENNIIPLWSVNAIKYCVMGLVLLMGFNTYLIFKQKPESEVNPISQSNPNTESYNQFFAEGHFEALSSLYPIELITEE
jgi:hypothetical protein